VRSGCCPTLASKQEKKKQPGGTIRKGLPLFRRRGPLKEIGITIGKGVLKERRAYHEKGDEEKKGSYLNFCSFFQEEKGREVYMGLSTPGKSPPLKDRKGRESPPGGGGRLPNRSRAAPERKENRIMGALR